jgi:hypothetical protein
VEAVECGGDVRGGRRRRLERVGSGVRATGWGGGLIGLGFFIGLAGVNGPRLEIWAARLAFPECRCAWHSGKGLFPECQGNYFILFLFFCVIFFEFIPHYLKLVAQIWGYFEIFWYISLVFFILLMNFLAYFKFELQVH